MATAKETDIATAFLKELRAPNTPLMRQAVIAWLRAESGSSVIGNNPWNLRPGADDAQFRSGTRTSTTGNGQFSVYPDIETGARAAAHRLVAAGHDYRKYDAVVAAARNGNPIDFLNALAKSYWDAGRYGTLNGGPNKLLSVYASIGGISNVVAALGTSIVKTVFGQAFNLSRGFSSSHDGIDLSAPEGTPVYAIAAGTVSYARNAANDSGATKNWAQGGGNVVNIDVGNRQTTQYAHLKSFVVTNGASVKKGQLIGYVGHTGNATGPHLHFGLWDHTTNKMIDPTNFISSDGKTEVGSLGAWNNIVTFPVGHVITADDVNTMMEKLETAGFFNEAVAGGMARSTTRVILTGIIGQKWDKALQDKLQAQFMASAAEAGKGPDLSGLTDLAAIAGKLVDPANWIRILALMAGAAMFAYGGINVLKASGAPTPSLPVPGA